MFWFHALLMSALIAVLAGFAVHPSAPDEPWAHRLACLVPLSLIAGTILTVVGG